jgi:hypothetical protein
VADLSVVPGAETLLGYLSTVGDHLIYESRLELARLLFAYFDSRVRDIVAQPFLLRAVVDQKSRKHIRD